jgi:chromosome segregation protein
MRLTKIKLAGFKSFVDPTLVSFPSNLTGIVGPNGCGKSNVIDAVRWVMGELSARHLRGDSMADVVFNGSSARKPVGAASVELIFDNADGKIGGPYSGYSEVSLRRQVTRDGNSIYLINGVRCRRKDITQLFLGTGLGSRSYAIIEQGMISRIIESKPEDMRSFVEEAAGISRYKERRRETESRIAETRENLERLQDVRDEIEKQLRHLQRQAGTARRYQALKERERLLSAQLLALRLRELDSGAQVHDSAVRARELAMQAELAEQRAAEAALEKQRLVHAEQSERVSVVQGRYYEVGALISRTEQSIQHTRELRERQRADLTQTHTTLNELALHVGRDERELARLRAELTELAPQLAAATRAESEKAAELAAAEQDLQHWQARWEEFNRALGAARQTTEVERARIEQLENQQRRLDAHAQRLAGERAGLAQQEEEAPLKGLTEQEAFARSTNEQLAQSLGSALERTEALRAEQLAVEARLEAARVERERVRTELVSLEALQQAAFHHGADEVTQWLRTAELGGRPRVASALEVAEGWESAVETALGDYLEALSVERIEALAGALDEFTTGRLALIEEGGSQGRADEQTLAAKVEGPVAVVQQLAHILTAETLAQALARRGSLEPGWSIMTRRGEWVGRDWLRIARGADAHTGVIEREHRLKELRGAFDAASERARALEAHLAGVRQSLAEAESERNAAQSKIQGAHRSHADLLGQLEAARARSQEAGLRRARIEEEAKEIAQELELAHAALARARVELAGGEAALTNLVARQDGMHAEREAHRAALAAARSAAHTAQLAARDLLVRSESVRTAENPLAIGLARMSEQRAQLAARCTELETELASGDAPIVELEARLAEALGQRLAVEAELAAARSALESADAELRLLDERRVSAEARAFDARTAMEQARLAASETRVRRESIAEQFAATRYELAEIQGGLRTDATVPAWEDLLNETRADVEKLGQVNLAAIDELKEQSERKEYLDRQYADLHEALTTLEQAMRRIDKETRTRFQETFERINTGLKEKFPRLFGGGHAYLELVGEDVLEAGVAVMARPPGKRNSTIHLLSGGEKALTAVALVFSIFDLNPAPFCLLDEVDAPLDEHNVGRFCDIVRDMSARIQFIVITHNKATMELASQLIGVTMSEPGVSRLVSVDIDEAIRLAAV